MGMSLGYKMAQTFVAAQTSHCTAIAKKLKKKHQILICNKKLSTAKSLTCRAQSFRSNTEIIGNIRHPTVINSLHYTIIIQLYNVSTKKQSQKIFSIILVRIYEILQNLENLFPSPLRTRLQLHFQ